ncbi:hypothetical protein [Streptomyces odontomachi]|uniref:hypothetical protein n=1 Tax=Streptomyces odontomachi TaxID=2944940 RepID=UPI00210D153A|nr:hypothetical protein [Streptomyces sp. ODS25]
MITDNGGSAAPTVPPSPTDDIGVLWKGFCTGYRVLADAEVADLCKRLLDHGIDQVPARAARELPSYVAPARPDEGSRPPALVMHSATRTTRGFDGDLADVRAGRDPYDVAGYLEARAVSLGVAGDLAVGRVRPWQEAVRQYGLDSVDIRDLDVYYLSDALLLAAAGEGPQPGVLEPVVEWVRARPSTVVRLYALDLETQVFLLWLKERAGLDVLHVDANSPVVSARWNRKNHVHPTVPDARAVAATGLAPDDLLAAEQRQSEGCRLLGMELPVLPGYLVERTDDPDTFAAGVVAAAALLTERYGLQRGCLKPCEAGDGARIVTGLALSDEAALRHHARAAHQHGDAYVLEAHTDFHPCTINGRRFILAPSGHVRGGQVLPGVTLQLMNGVSWEGNVTLTEEDCVRFGLPARMYGDMMTAMHATRDAFHGPQSAVQGCQGGMVTGGVDFAVGRIGGVFGDRIVLGAIDFNLSSHGAEYMRAFQDEVADRATHVATRVYRPDMAADLDTTVRAVAGLTPGSRWSKVVASVPGRWGMVAVTGTGLEDAVGAAEELVTGLRAAGLAGGGTA